MKKLFTIILGAALMLCGTKAFAQLSVGAGWLNSTEITKYTSGDPDKDNFNGLYIGGQYNLEIVGNFGVAPGLYMSALFGNYMAQGTNIGITGTVRAKYREIAINVPVNLNYSLELGRDFNLIFYAGPVFQVGAVSKSSVEVSAGGLGIFATTGKYTLNNYSGKWKASDGKEYNDPDGPNRNLFNIYLGGGIGFQAGDFQVIVGYDHSLLNISKISNENMSRSQIKLGLGLAF